MSTAPFSIKSSVVFLASELGLAAFVTYFQQEWYVFAGLSVLLFIGLLLYNYKRRVEPWHLILTGLIGVVIFSSTALAGVIWLRYWRPNTTVLEFSEQVYVQPKLPEKSSDFNWGFERHKGYNFIGMSQMDGKIVIHQFQAQGRNLTPDLLVKVRGHVRSDRTGKEFEIVFNLAGQMAKADEINPIPVNAIVDTRAYFSDDEKPISMEKFFGEIVPFTFFFEYDGKQYRKSFTQADIDPLIAEYSKVMREKAVKPPMMSKKQ